jgi:hypothetical protein
VVTDRMLEMFKGKSGKSGKSSDKSAGGDK